MAEDSPHLLSGLQSLVGFRMHIRNPKLCRVKGLEFRNYGLEFEEPRS